MAQIDVSEILADPDLVDPIIIVSRKPFVNEYGENQLEETSFSTYGSVQSISGKTLQRIPEALRVVPDLKSFFVRGTITSAGDSRYPDILVFNGYRYAVQVVFDWTNWGSGWSEGTCVVERLQS